MYSVLTHNFSSLTLSLYIMCLITIILSPLSPLMQYPPLNSIFICIFLIL